MSNPTPNPLPEEAPSKKKNYVKPVLIGSFILAVILMSVFFLNNKFKKSTPTTPLTATTETPNVPANKPAAPFQRPKAPRDFQDRPERFAPREPRPTHLAGSPQTKLWMNLGAEMGVGPGDVVGAILGETGLPTGTVGVVDIRERHLFVDVKTEHAQVILSRLRRARIKGRPLKIKVA